MIERKNYRTGRIYELRAGYSRAVRIDKASGVICVGGTTSTDESGNVLHAGDAYAQAHEALKIIKSTLEALGGSMESVVRTRIYVVDLMANQEAIGRVHREVFDAIQPSETMVGVAALAHPDMLVEIEAEAMV